jgi:hypothetical protein
LNGIHFIFVGFLIGRYYYFEYIAKAVKKYFDKKKKLREAEQAREEKVARKSKLK